MCDILNNYQGIIVTVIGAFLGGFLSKLNQSGKVSFFADNINIEYFSKDKGGAIYKRYYSNEIIYGNFTFDLDISNTSSNNRMLRQIYCSLNFSDKTLKKEFDDVDSKGIIAAKEYYEKVVVLNLHSKSIVNKKLSVYLPKEDILNFRDDKVKISFTFTKLWGIKKQKSILLATLLNGEIQKYV